MADPRARQSDPEAFIASLFAPLPEGEELAASEAFKALLGEDAVRRWQTDLAKAKEIDQRVRALDARKAANPNAKRSVDEMLSGLDLWFELHEAIGVLIMQPAPSEREFRWKLRHCRSLGGSRAWDDAIEADAARLGLKRQWA